MNEVYPNTGICLVNMALFRKDNLYRAAFYAAKTYKKLDCPFQDIFFLISNFKFNFLPLRYNAKLLFEDDEQLKNKNIHNKYFEEMIRRQQYSSFKYTVDELLDAALNPVINHFYNDRLFGLNKCTGLIFQWIK